MKKIITTLLLAITASLYSQEPIIETEVNFGGSLQDGAQTIQLTIDGGYVVAGTSESNDGDVGGNNGGYDYWIVKLDQNLNLQWETNLGGSDWEILNSIQQTTDNGYIVAGNSYSNDGDVGGNNGESDYWIVKLDANGNLIWETNLGGSNSDDAQSIKQTIDGGYIAAGYTHSNDGDVGGNNGSSDYWIVKLDVNGNLIWEKNFGGSNIDQAYSIQQIADGSYIIAGNAQSSDGDVGANNGQYDYWIIKLDINGNLVWEKNLGGTGTDGASHIQQTTDNGFIVTGTSSSNNGDVGGNNGSRDFWIVKLDANGNLIWENNIGGSAWDEAYSIQQTTDGGYIVVGDSVSNDGDVEGNNGNDDYWIAKLDATGTLFWETNLGGSGFDSGKSVQQTLDGGYLVAGNSFSADGDVGANNGYWDFWIVKIGATLNTKNNLLSKNISLTPNPVTNRVTINNFSQEITKIEIVDMLGRLMFSQTDIQNNTLNISDLQPATYLVKIHSGKTIFTKKIIKK